MSKSAQLIPAFDASSMAQFVARFLSPTTGTISCTVTDGFNFSASVGKRAIFSAMAQENMSLADMDQNLGNFIASLVDQIEMAAATGCTSILNVSSNDSFNFSGAVSSIPNGKVSVSFSLKIPGADFSMKTTTIVFNLK